ncbi:velvet factor-domain-containing protein [Entophlyctis helioformis]|nr:velvet factor-domain-containing protein [Entophlyctis helioformis]
MTLLGQNSTWANPPAPASTTASTTASMSATSLLTPQDPALMDRFIPSVSPFLEGKPAAVGINMSTSTAADSQASMSSIMNLDTLANPKISPDGDMGMFDSAESMDASLATLACPSVTANASGLPAFASPMHSSMHPPMLPPMHPPIMQSMSSLSSLSSLKSTKATHADGAVENSTTTGSSAGAAMGSSTAASSSSSSLPLPSQASSTSSGPQPPHGHTRAFSSSILEEASTHRHDPRSQPLSGTHAARFVDVTRDVLFNNSLSQVERSLCGQLVTHADIIKESFSTRGVFFSFPDLGVRVEGIYRIRIVVSRVALTAEGDADISLGRHVDLSTVIAESITDAFVSYSPRDWPGFLETTALSKRFAMQGVKIPVRRKPFAQPPPRIVMATTDTGPVLPSTF